MEGKRYEIVFVVVLLNFIILGVNSQVDESNKDAQPHYEYIQIFKSIPALFEYLLDALEERPEILEKNDVTMFNRNIGVADAEEDDTENSKSQEKMDKRDTVSVAKEQDEHGANDVYKRYASTSKGVSKTTAAYEYGNSNVVMKGLDEIENNKAFAKRFTNTDDFNDFADKGGIKRELLLRENRISRKKRSVLSKLDDDTSDMFWNYGEVFLGFEHLFGLDLKPEEIEERILTAEKLLEEHNNKKSAEGNIKRL